MQYSAQDIADLINQAADSDALQRSAALRDIGQASDFFPFRPALVKLASLSESVLQIRKNAMDTIFQDCLQTKSCPADYIPLFTALLSNPQEAPELHNKALNCIEVTAEHADPQNGIDPQLEKLLIKTATGKNHIGEPIMKNTNIRGRTLNAMYLQIEAMGDDTTYSTTIHDMMDESKEPSPDIRANAISTLNEIVDQVTRNILPHVSAFDRATDIKQESHEANRNNALICIDGLIQSQIPSDVWETTVSRNLSYSTDGLRTPYETSYKLREYNADIIVLMANFGHNPSSGHKLLTDVANPKTGDKSDLVRNHFLDCLEYITPKASGKDLAHYVTLLKDSTDPLSETPSNRRMAAKLLDTVITHKGKIEADEEAILLRGMENTLEGDADTRMGMIQVVQHHIMKIGVAQFQQEHPRIVASLMHAETKDPNRGVQAEAGIALSHLQNYGTAGIAHYAAGGGSSAAATPPKSPQDPAPAEQADPIATLKNAIIAPDFSTCKTDPKTGLSTISARVFYLPPESNTPDLTKEFDGKTIKLTTSTPADDLENSELLGKALQFPSVKIMTTHGNQIEAHAEIGRLDY